MDFKKYEGHKMTAQEFSKNLTKHRRATKFGQKLSENNTAILDGRHVKAKEEDFLSTNRQITAKLFKDKEHMTLDEYFALRDELQKALWHYEFCQYETFEEDGKLYMTTQEFLKSLFIYLPYGQYKQYLDRMENDLKHLKESKVSIDEYISFAFFLQEVDEIMDIIDEFRFIDKEKFTDMVREYEKSRLSKHHF